MLYRSLKNVCLIFLLAGTIGIAADEFLFVKDGKAQCRIQKGTSEGENDFCKIVNEGAFKVSGANLASNTAKRQIRTAIDPSLDPEGFTFTFPDKNTLLVKAGGNWGMRYAAYDFLERYFGIRWLFPGKLGEYVPQKKTVSASGISVKQAPHYLTRFFQGGSYKATQEYYDWTMKLKGQVMNRRLEQHHALWTYIPTKKYAKTHPEFYPFRDGKRFIPETDIYWNPCFTAPGIAEEFAKNILASLDRNPKTTTISLAVNDGGGFCQCKRCIAVDGTKRNGFGSPHRTKSYILFLNKVASLVTKKYPNVSFGFIAYGETADAISGLKLHPALVPVFTYDRQQLMDSARKQLFMKRVGAWRKLSKYTGSYDYIYGSTYALPRVYFHLMADYLKEGYAAGERHYINEYMPGKNYSDSPKAYLALKLAWNTKLNPDAVLDEWYRCVAGPKGAPALKEYFTRLEKFWTGMAVRKTKWFSKDRTYLSWDDPSFLNAMDPAELTKLEALLVQSVKLAEKPERVRYFLDEFRSRLPKIKQFMANRKVQEAGARQVFDNQEAFHTFNTSNNGWGNWKETKMGSFTVDPAGGMDGSGALRINNSRNTRTSMCFMKGFTTVPGRTYRVSVWARAKDLPEPYGDISMSARFQKAGKWMPAAYNVDTSFKYDGKSEWVPLSLTVKAPDIKGITLIVLLGNGRAAGGYVWFDNFRLESQVRSEAEIKKVSAAKYVRKAGDVFNGPQYRLIHAGGAAHMKNVPGAGTNGTSAYVLDGKGSKGKGICCFNIYKVKSGKPCRVTLKYRTEGLPKAAVAELTIKWQNGKPAWIASNRNLSIVLPHSEKWTAKQIAAIAPDEPDCRVIPMIGLMNTDQGKLYIDEILIDVEQ